MPERVPVTVRTGTHIIISECKNRKLDKDNRVRGQKAAGNRGNDAVHSSLATTLNNKCCVLGFRNDLEPQVVVGTVARGSIWTHVEQLQQHCLSCHEVRKRWLPVKQLATKSWLGSFSQACGKQLIFRGKEQMTPPAELICYKKASQ